MSTLAEHLRPRAGEMVHAPHRWRELGVTHWHCIVREPEAVGDPRRFDHDRARIERVRSSAEVVHSPAEVASWLIAVTDDLAPGSDRAAARGEIWLRMAEHGMDVCTMMAVSPARIVHYSAYAMTPQSCSVH